MSRQRSKTVSEKVHELYALMATIAAKKALHWANNEDVSLSEHWAEVTGKWLDKSSAYKVTWTYDRPRIS